MRPASTSETSSPTTGQIEPSVSDSLRAVGSARLVSDRAIQGADTYFHAFMIYHEFAAQITTAEQFQEFGRRLDANVKLRELHAGTTCPLGDLERLVRESN